MDEYSIGNTHEALKHRLIEYIETAYFGKNDELRDLCKKELEEQGVLWKEPYIEANPAYKTIENGINESDKIPDGIKEILARMIEDKLGVYRNPYCHQIQAIESFYSGNNLFVATGTGSGKTECFMWPMVTKLINEAKNQSVSWRQRGVRAMMLYPMNALVSDQIGRLRRMIGSEKFYEMFHEYTGQKRRPQFGMYTGRTPYAGEAKRNQDTELAKTLKKNLIDRDEQTIMQLKTMGKFPAKYNIGQFIDGLLKGKHDTDYRDAELITRFEMQQITPDILITNYSMLEYMLMRTEEQNIWNDTKIWLNESTDNKLLFIIDEAHMYRGAAGGEVALLIRRFINKLGVSRDKIQFILTSASIPQNANDKIQEFVCDLTAIDRDEDKKIDIIVGEREKLVYKNLISVDPYALSKFNIDLLHGEKKYEAIKEVCDILGLDTDKCDFSKEQNIENYLYEKLPQIEQLLIIMECCRGKACSFETLSEKVFPDCEKDISQKATSVLLAIAPIAKNTEGQALFPSRLHMMFRGIQGIYACSNPCCTQRDKSTNLSIGKVYIGNHEDICECGGKVYELLNDRSCGAIFLKGYFDETEPSAKFIWNKKGANYEDNFKEIHFYVIPDNVTCDRKDNVKTGWLNSFSGRLEVDDSSAGTPGYLHVAYSTNCPKDNKFVFTFSSCPKCKKRHLHVTDFATKGNEPFFHLVSEQLMIQPPVITDKKQLELTPNAGRKVLLFSDSRQRAATLAKELTAVADEDAMRKAIAVAAKELNDWNRETGKDDSMDLLYVSFLKVALEHNLRFFYGSDERDLHEHLQEMKDTIEKISRRGRRKFDYADLKKQKFATVPELYSSYLLRIICSNFRSFSDLGLCWIEPCKTDVLYDALDDLEDVGVKLDEDFFTSFFAAWAAEVLTDTYAYDYDIVRQVRRGITNIVRFGLAPDGKLPTRYEKLFEENNIDKKKQAYIYKALLKFTQKGKDDNENYYLNPSLISLKFDASHSWYKCPNCGRVFPFTLWGKCVWCCEGKPIQMKESEFEGLEFWRQPILDAVAGKNDALMTRINTEEHTAQLSHKDQRIDMWSTTEEYELRFQNVYIDDKGPVDVLSCTTTMEVGIDIGSLTAVGLRNIPPMRENYQQRAGRAGRRGSAISTIVTYTDNGPHDSYYFNNPEKIIAGEPRYPSIDMHNQKLIYRHMNVVYFSDYLDKYCKAANTIGIIDFINNYYDEFCAYINNKAFSKERLDGLIPSLMQNNLKEQKMELLVALQHLKYKVDEFNEDYYDSNDNEKKLLDVMLEEGIFPTYSFPRNVVGFSIENANGSKIEQEPDRSLDMAISEYAPGRLIVVNKKTYKSGGIYNFHSKFKEEDREHPARKCFDSNEYSRMISYCENRSCNWVGDLISGNICPFCKHDSIKVQRLVKPWGFAPIGGTSIREAQAEAEMSYAELPSYASPIKDEEMLQSIEYPLIRYGRLVDQPLTILNQGPESKGFTMCTECGAAVPGDDIAALQKISQPYRHPHIKTKCTHTPDNVINAFLGHRFMTDMVLIEITLYNDVINTDYDAMWINSAAQTLTEAMVLAAGQLLDVEFSDLKGGYRLRNDKDKVFVDIFLFDSLSSGAGYSSMLAGRLHDLLDQTEMVLKCKNNCSTACHDCLKHFWNQRVQDILDRHAAKQLLDWAKKEKMADIIPYDRQCNLIKGIKENALVDAKFNIVFENSRIYAVNKDGNKREIYIYPAMWRKNNAMIPAGCIAISDKQLINSMPTAYSAIRVGVM